MEEKALPPEERKEREVEREAHRVMANNRLKRAKAPPRPPPEETKALEDRAEEIAALPPAERRKAEDEDRKKDMADPELDEVAKAERSMERNRLKREARLRMADMEEEKQKMAAEPEEEQKPFVEEVWKETAKAADRFVRLPRSKQEEEKKRMEEAGDIPEEWKIM